MRFIQGFSLAICLIVGLVAAIDDGAWMRHNEYRYNLRTRTLTAIPDLKNQWIGVFGRGILTIRPYSDDVLVGKLENVQYAEVHEELADGWDQHIPEDQLVYNSVHSNEKPFEVRMRNGVIHSIAVDKSMTNTDVNQLKAVLSQLQVDIRAQNVIKGKHNQLLEDGDHTQAIYKVMEPTVTGKSETLYDISPLPEYLIQTHPEWVPLPELKYDGMHYKIVKTKNYDHSVQRLGYHFGLSGANEWKANTNTMGEAVTKSAVSNVVISGKYDNYTIQSSVTVNKVIAKPGQTDQQNAHVVGAVNLTLESVRKTDTEDRPIVDAKQLIDVGNLIYTYDLPSDPTNHIRPMEDSSEEETHVNDLHKSRPRRSLVNEEEQKNRRFASELKSDSEFSSFESKFDSIESREQFHQPRPTLTKAPEYPLSPMFMGFRGQSIQTQKIDVLEVARKLVEEIGNDLQKPSDIPLRNPLTKFNILAELIRTMDAKQIELLAEELYVAEPEDEATKEHLKLRIASWMTFRDAVTDAGTGPAITQSMKWIQERKIRGEDAAQLIAAWPKTIREPTEEMQRAFFRFAISESVYHQSNVNVTALMSLTRFLHMAQVSNQTARNNYPVNSFGPLADRNNRFVVATVIPHLAEKLRDAVVRRDAQHVLLYVRVLGNLGHPAVLNVFEPYLEGKETVTDFQRLAMVVALDFYTWNYPNTARNVLYKIYQNAGERHELRVAAVFQLILTRPDETMLLRMAEQTNTEANLHVRAAVHSALESAARLEAPEYAEFAASARAAAQLLPKEKLGMQYSRTDLRDYVMKELNMAYGQQLSWIVSEDSLLPSSFFVRTEKNMGGFRYRSEHQAMVSSIDRLTNVLTGQFESLRWRGEQTRNEKEGEWTLSLDQLLNIQTDEAEKLEGQLLFSVMNGKRFFTFDKNTLEQLPQLVRKFAAVLKNGYRLDYTKLYNAEATTIMFPLETGFPFIYNKHAPTLVRTYGKIHVRSTPELTEGPNGELHLPKTLNLTGDIEAVYSTAIDAAVGFVNPFNHHRYESGYTQKAQVYAPVRVAVNIDLVNGQIVSELRPLEQNKAAQVFHLSSWPYTGRQDILALRPMAESEYKKLIHTREAHPIEFTFGDRTTGFAFAVQATHEKDTQQIAYAWMKYSKLNFHSVWSMFQTFATPELFELNVRFEPKLSTADSAKITFAYNTELIEGENKETKWTHPRARDSIKNKENMAILSSSSSTENYGYERRQELLRNAAAGIANVGAQVMEVAIEFSGKGKNKAEYVATVATAKGLVGDKARFLVVMSGKNYEKISSSKPRLYQVCIHAEGKRNYVSEMNFHDVLDHLKEGSADLHLTYGDRCDSNSAAHLHSSTKFDQTEAFKTFLRENPTAAVCLREMSKGNYQTPSCQYIIDYAHTFNHAKFELNLEKMPKVMRESVGDMFEWLRFTDYFENVDRKSSNNNKDRVEIDARFTPDMNTLHLNVITPTSEMVTIPLRVPAWTRYVMSPRLNFWERIQRDAINYQDVCVIDANQLTTFDNHSMHHELGHEWHVAMYTVQPKYVDEIDSVEQRRIYKEDDSVMSIYVRDSLNAIVRDEKEPLRKDVNIIFGRQSEGKYQKIELRPAVKSGKYVPRIFLNGVEEYPTLKNVVLLRTEKSAKPLVQAFATPEGEIHLTIFNGDRQLKLKYDGKRVKVQADATFRKNVRGICGTYTGQHQTDMTSPDNCIFRRGQDFIAAWAVIDGVSAKHYVREAGKSACIPQTFTTSNMISEQEAGREQIESTVSTSSSSSASSESLSNESMDRTESIQTQHEMIFLQKDGQLCFSKRMVPVCPKGSKADSVMERPIEAHCRDESEPAAQHYRDQIIKGQKPNMSKYETNGKFNYAVPRKCVRA